MDRKWGFLDFYPVKVKIHSFKLGAYGRALKVTQNDIKNAKIGYICGTDRTFSGRKFPKSKGGYTNGKSQKNFFS